MFGIFKKKIVKVRRRSPWSKVVHERRIEVDISAFNAWKDAFDGKKEGVPHLQDAFPKVSAGDREYLLSGITPEEWALDAVNAERSANGRALVENIDDYSDEQLEMYFGITQRSRVISSYTL